MASAIVRHLSLAYRQFSLGRQARVLREVVVLADKVKAARVEIELMPVGTPKSGLENKSVKPLQNKGVRLALFNVASQALAAVGAVLRDTMPAH